MCHRGGGWCASVKNKNREKRTRRVCGVGGKWPRGSAMCAAEAEVGCPCQCRGTQVRAAMICHEQPCTAPSLPSLHRVETWQAELMALKRALEPLISGLVHGVLSRLGEALMHSHPSPRKF
eukprot:3211914-Rhodomonas_salina.3